MSEDKGNSKQPLGAAGYMPEALRELAEHYTKHHKFYYEKNEHDSKPDSEDQLLRAELVLCNPRQKHSKLSMLYERRVADVNLNQSCPASEPPAGAGRTIPQFMPLDIRLAIGKLMASDGYALVDAKSNKEQSIAKLIRHDADMQQNPDDEGDNAFYTECSTETVTVGWTAE